MEVWQCAVSLWLGKHTMKLGASITYDVTKQLFQPLQNGVYTFNGNPTQFPIRRSTASRSRSCRKRRSCIPSPP